ncbi:MAG: hypothetical protein HQL32_15520 [Planctomycetes bacterium]|nr:hypothetical protein [Planctomycetota bacterium]
MAKMIKDSTKLVCPKCGEDVAFARVFKTWVDPKKDGDTQFRGMVRRCKCGSFDASGQNVKSLVG